jgi:hypothetical protein
VHLVGFIIRVYSLFILGFLIAASFMETELWWICMWHTLLATILVTATACILCSWYLLRDTLHGILSSDLCNHWWSRTWHVMSLHRVHERDVKANCDTRFQYFYAPKQLTPWWQMPKLLDWLQTSQNRTLCQFSPIRTCTVHLWTRSLVISVHVTSSKILIKCWLWFI